MTAESALLRRAAEKLRELAEGSVVITHGIAWAKTGPDEWRCPFRMHVPDQSISPRWRGRYQWYDIRDSEWVASVATVTVFDYAEWERDPESIPLARSILRETGGE